MKLLQKKIFTFLISFCLLGEGFLYSMKKDDRTPKTKMIQGRTVFDLEIVPENGSNQQSDLDNHNIRITQQFDSRRVQFDNEYDANMSSRIGELITLADQKKKQDDELAQYDSQALHHYRPAPPNLYAPDHSFLHKQQDKKVKEDRRQLEKKRDDDQVEKEIIKEIEEKKKAEENEFTKNKRKKTVKHKRVVKLSHDKLDDQVFVNQKSINGEDFVPSFSSGPTYSEDSSRFRTSIGRGIESISRDYNTYKICSDFSRQAGISLDDFTQSLPSEYQNSIQRGRRVETVGKVASEIGPEEFKQLASLVLKATWYITKRVAMLPLDTYLTYDSLTRKLSIDGQVKEDDKSSKVTSYNLQNKDKQHLLSRLKYLDNFLASRKWDSIVSLMNGSSLDLRARISQAVRIVNAWLNLLGKPAPLEKHILVDSALEKDDFKREIERCCIEFANEVMNLRCKRGLFIKQSLHHFQEERFDDGRSFLEKALGEHTQEGVWWNRWYDTRKILEDLVELENKEYQKKYKSVLSQLPSRRLSNLEKSFNRFTRSRLTEQSTSLVSGVKTCAKNLKEAYKKFNQTRKEYISAIDDFKGEKSLDATKKLQETYKKDYSDLDSCLSQYENKIKEAKDIFGNLERVFKKSYTPTNKTPYATNFENAFEGTVIQQQLHKEIVDTLNSVSNLYLEHVGQSYEINKNRHLDNITSFIIAQLQAAQHYNEENKIDNAISVLEVAHKLRDLANKIVEFTAERETSFSNAFGSLFSWGEKNYQHEFGKRFNEFIAKAPSKVTQLITDKINDVAGSLSQAIEDSYDDSASFKKAMLSDGQKHLDATKKRSLKDFQNLVKFVIGQPHANIKTDDLLNAIALEDQIWSQGSSELLCPLQICYRKALEKAVEKAKKIDSDKVDSKQKNEQKQEDKKKKEKSQTINQDSSVLDQSNNATQYQSIAQNKYERSPDLNILDGDLMCGFFAAYNGACMLDEANDSTNGLRLSDMTNEQTFNQWLLERGQVIDRFPQRNNLRANHIESLLGQQGSFYRENTTVIELSTLQNSFVTHNNTQIFLPVEDAIIDAIRAVRETGARHLVILNTGSHWISLLVSRDSVEIADSLNNNMVNHEAVEFVRHLFTQQEILHRDEIRQLRRQLRDVQLTSNQHQEVINLDGEESKEPPKRRLIKRKKRKRDNKPFEKNKKTPEKQKDTHQKPATITSLNSLGQLSDTKRYGNDHVLMCGYYAAHAARILDANHDQSHETLTQLLNDRSAYEQQTLRPGVSFIRGSRKKNNRRNRDGISYLEGYEIEDILAGGQTMNGNIIVYGTGRIDSDVRSYDLIDQFKKGQIDHLVYVLATENRDSHWISVLVRRNQNQEVEFIITDSLGRDNSSLKNVQDIVGQFTSGGEQRSDTTSKEVTNKNKRKRDNQTFKENKKKKPEDDLKAIEKKIEEQSQNRITRSKQKELERLKQTQNSLLDKITNPSIIQDDSINQQLPLLYDHNPYKDIFAGCENSVLDKKHHEKLISINKEMSQLLEHSKHNVLMQSNADIIYCFTSLAKLQEDPEVAAHLTDFCDYFVQAAKAEDAAFTKIAKTLTRGTVLGVRDNLRYTAQVWKKRINDPVGAFKDELVAYQKAGEALGRALSLAVSDPITFGTKTYQKLSSIIRGAQDDPEQFIAAVVGFLLPTDPLGNKLKQRFTSGLKSALKKQANLAAKVVTKKTKDYCEKSINSLKETSKHVGQGLQKSIQKVGKGIEQILPRVKTYEQARNKALEIIGDMGLYTEPVIGRLPKSASYGKITGRRSKDKKVLWRLDFDPQKGPHINVEDYRFGKKMKAKKYCIPFDGDENTVKSLLRHLNK